MENDNTFTPDNYNKIVYLIFSGHTRKYGTLKTEPAEKNTGQ